MEIVPSIIDYIGRFEGGIFVKIGLMWNGKFYDSIFYYTDKDMVLTIDESMISDMDMFIEQHPEYLDLLKTIINMVDPYDSIIKDLEEIVDEKN